MDNAKRQFECVGCGQKRQYSLVVQEHGQKHINCKQTNGCVGYWVEIPQDTPESPISAAEQDYIESFGVYND